MKPISDRIMRKLELLKAAGGEAPCDGKDSILDNAAARVLHRVGLIEQIGKGPGLVISAHAHIEPEPVDDVKWWRVVNKEEQ